MKVIKSGMRGLMDGTQSVQGRGEKCMKNFVRKHGGEKPFGRKIIKCIHLATLHMNQQQVPVNTVTETWIQMTRCKMTHSSDCVSAQQ
jgi:hypothetical protein